MQRKEISQDQMLLLLGNRYYSAIRLVHVIISVQMLQLILEFDNLFKFSMINFFTQKVTLKEYKVES